eukprot:m.198096 g.198096  ORF g.198096 m.198096 type:complete len:906 (+) comp16832_c1_seq1:150-2867(+)
MDTSQTTTEGDDDDGVQLGETVAALSSTTSSFADSIQMDPMPASRPFTVGSIPSEDPLRDLESRLDELLERNRRQQQQTRQRTEVLSVLNRLKTAGDESDEQSSQADEDSIPDHFVAAEMTTFPLTHTSQPNSTTRQGPATGDEKPAKSRIPVLSELQGMEVEVSTAITKLRQQLHDEEVQEQLTRTARLTQPSESAASGSLYRVSGANQRSKISPDVEPEASPEDAVSPTHSESENGSSYSSDFDITSSHNNTYRLHMHGDADDDRFHATEPSLQPRQKPTVQHLLGQELARERQRRLRAEGALQTLEHQVALEQDRVRQANHRMATVMETLSRLETTLSKSTQKNKSLYDVITQKNHSLEQAEKTERQLQNKIRDLERELRVQAEQYQAQGKVIMDLKTEVQRCSLQQMERVRTAELNALAMQSQAEMHKQSLKQANKSIQKLQSALTERDQRHSRDMEGLVSLHGPEVQRLIHQRELDFQSQFQLVQQTQQRELEECRSAYQKLEGEFNATVHYERQRCSDLETQLAAAQADCQQLHATLDLVKDEASRNTQLMDEMAGVIRQQRDHLKQQSIRLKTANREMTCRNESLKHDLKQQHRQRQADQRGFQKTIERLKEAQAKNEAQENIIAGLRQERDLWSKELATQGASLAADRGKLEANVHLQEERIAALQTQLTEATQATSIKEKIIDDQGLELKALRQRVADAEREKSRLFEQQREREADLQDRLDVERELSQQLQADLEVAVEKNNRLRETLSELSGESETLRKENARLRTSWEDTGMRLGQLELEVQSMEKTCKKREEDAVRARDEAHAKVLEVTQALDAAKQTHQKELDKITHQHEEVLQVLDTTRQELEQAYQTIQQQDIQLREAQGEANRWRRAQDDKIAKLQALVQELNTGTPS